MSESAAAAMGRISVGGGGGDANVFINLAELGGASLIWTATGAGGEAQVPAPDEILLGHDLLHADRFMRGQGAFAGGAHILGNYVRVGGAHSAASREEIYNIGLPVALGVPANPDPGPVLNENILRGEHGLFPRTRYT